MVQVRLHTLTSTLGIEEQSISLPYKWQQKVQMRWDNPESPSYLPLHLDHTGPVLGISCTTIIWRWAPSAIRAILVDICAVVARYTVIAIATVIAVSTVIAITTVWLRATLLTMAVLEALLTLDATPVLRLGAAAAHMTHCVAVTAAVNLRLRAVDRVMTGLQTVEAGTTASAATATATTRLEGLRAVHLAVSGWD
jgi:hypothetical protein